MTIFFKKTLFKINAKLLKINKTKLANFSKIKLIKKKI